MFSRTVLSGLLFRISVTGDQFDVALNGTSSFAISDSDAVAPAKIAAQKAETIKVSSIRCGMAVAANTSAPDECKALAKLPSREILIAQLLEYVASAHRVVCSRHDAIAQKKAE